MFQSKIEAVVFDLDGTLYLGNTVVEEAVEIVNMLKGMNIKVYYATNNSTKVRSDILAKLINMGFEANIEDIYTSSYAASKYINENNIEDVYCIGTEGLKNELINNNINVTSSEDKAKALVIGHDPQFNYDKLSSALNVIRNKSNIIIACNRDRHFPIENGRLLPGCGPIVAAIEESFNRKADYVVGKPGAYMMELIAEGRNIKKENLLVVGDYYDYDIEMAKKFGCQSVLISSEEKLNHKDTIVIKELKDLKKFF